MRGHAATSGRTLTATRPGAYGDGRGGYGLILRIKTTKNGRTARQWVKIRIDGRPTHLGLRSYPTTTLAEARRQALHNVREINAGRDPRDEGLPTLERATEKVITLHRDGWKPVQQDRTAMTEHVRDSRVPAPRSETDRQADYRQLDDRGRPSHSFEASRGVAGKAQARHGDAMAGLQGLPAGQPCRGRPLTRRYRSAPTEPPTTSLCTIRPWLVLSSRSGGRTPASPRSSRSSLWHSPRPGRGKYGPPAGPTLTRTPECGRFRPSG